MSKLLDISGQASGNTIGPLTSTTNSVALYSDGTGGILKNSTLSYDGTTLSGPSEYKQGTVTLLENPNASTFVGMGSTLTGAYTGTGNIAFGGGGKIITSAQNNIIIGLGGDSITTGSSNVVFGGQYTLSSCSTGLANVAIGNNTLTLCNTTGNCAIGQSTLASITTNGQCCSFGSNSLVNSQGLANTAHGYFAGNTTLGEKSSFFGAYADGASGISNSSAVGYQSYATLSNQIKLGNSLLLEVVPHQSGACELGTNTAAWNGLALKPITTLPAAAAGNKGVIKYDNTNGAPYYSNGTIWTTMAGGGGGGGPASQIATSGTAVDINPTIPLANQILKTTDGTNCAWSSAGSGDVTGPGATVATEMASFSDGTGTAITNSVSGDLIIRGTGFGSHAIVPLSTTNNWSLGTSTNKFMNLHLQAGLTMVNNGFSGAGTFTFTTPAGIVTTMTGNVSNSFCQAGSLVFLSMTSDFGGQVVSVNTTSVIGSKFFWRATSPPGFSTSTTYTVQYFIIKIG